MEHLEQELRKALRRQQPGDEFTRRVLRKAGEEQPALRRWWAGLKLRWVTAAVMCAMAAGGWVYRERRRAEGEAARRQAIMALQIAGAKLRLAQDKVQSLARQ